MLLKLVPLSKTKSIQSSILHSLGKTAITHNSVKVIKPFINSLQDSDRISANWALGRIGSREKDNYLPINIFYEIIDMLVDQLSKEKHNDAKRNCIYALGEICDRRNHSKDIVNEQVAIKTIKSLENLLKSVAIHSLKDLSAISLNSTIEKFTRLSINMIKGIKLSSEEEQQLLTIRTKLK